MSQAQLILQRYPKHTDTLSETSTDSDDYPCTLTAHNARPHPIPAHHQQKTKANKIKSSLCKRFAENGYCPYGLKCQFAHGLQELKCNISENSYKTKPCNSFWRKGACPYGHRCNFLHWQSRKMMTSREEGEKEEWAMGYREVMYGGRIAQGSRLAVILE